MAAFAGALDGVALAWAQAIVSTVGNVAARSR
jgi:hypothetical protein